MLLIGTCAKMMWRLSVRLPAPTQRFVPPLANITIPALPISVARAPPPSPKLKKHIPVVHLSSRSSLAIALASQFLQVLCFQGSGEWLEWLRLPLFVTFLRVFLAFCGGRKVAGAGDRSVGRDARRESSPWGAHPTGAKIQGSYRRQSEAQSRHANLRGHRLGYAFPHFRSFAAFLGYCSYSR